MSEIYNDNIKRPKRQDIPLGILKIYAFYQKIQHRTSGPGRSTAGVTQYLPLRIQQKTQWFKEGCSWSIVVTQSLQSLMQSVMYLELFLGRPVHTSNPQRHHHDWCQAEKFSKFAPSDTLNMHSWQSVFRFPCKTFSKLLKLTLRKTLFRG